jgi:hypothetical protein
MSLINTAYLLYNNRLIKELDLSSRQPELFQDKLLRYLLTHGQQTAFGKEFGLNEILSISDFQQHVPPILMTGWSLTCSEASKEKTMCCGTKRFIGLHYPAERLLQNPNLFLSTGRTCIIVIIKVC